MCSRPIRFAQKNNALNRRTPTRGLRSTSPRHCATNMHCSSKKACLSGTIARRGKATIDYFAPKVIKQMVALQDWLHNPRLVLLPCWTKSPFFLLWAELQNQGCFTPPPVHQLFTDMQTEHHGDCTSSAARRNPPGLKSNSPRVFSAKTQRAQKLNSTVVSKISARFRILLGDHNTEFFHQRNFWYLDRFLIPNLLSPGISPPDIVWYWFDFVEDVRNRYQLIILCRCW